MKWLPLIAQNTKNTFSALHWGQDPSAVGPRGLKQATEPR